MSDTDATRSESEAHWAAESADPEKRQRSIAVLLRMIQVASVVLAGDEDAELTQEDIIGVGAQALFSLGVNLEESTAAARALDEHGGLGFDFSDEEEATDV